MVFKNQGAAGMVWWVRQRQRYYDRQATAGPRRVRRYGLALRGLRQPAGQQSRNAEVWTSNLLVMIKEKDLIRTDDCSELFMGQSHSKARIMEPGFRSCRVEPTL